MLSVVIPVYNEAPLIHTLYDRLKAVLDGALKNHSAEIIFVDDGSRDGTFDELRHLHGADSRVKILRLARCFGHQTAISAGLETATGERVVVMDGDLQDPPELIPEFMKRLDEGYDVAYGVRVSRKEGWVKRLAYTGFYRLMRVWARIEVPLDAGDFCMMRRVVVVTINDLPERNRFVRGLRSWVGYRQTGVPYDRQEREAGPVKYTWGKLLRLSLDGLVSFSDTPLRIASYFGFLVAMASFIGIGVVLYFRLFTNQSVPGFASLAILILFLGGVQLLAVGLLGEYVGRIFDEVKRRPLYVIAEWVGWPDVRRQEER